MDNIGVTKDLYPKAKYFDEVGDTCINVDGAIELVKTAGTPQARAIWLAYRKQLVLVMRDNSIKGAEKQREEAFFRALKELNIKTNFTPIKGTF